MIFIVLTLLLCGLLFVLIKMDWINEAIVTLFFLLVSLFFLAVTIGDFLIMSYELNPVTVPVTSEFELERCQEELYEQKEAYQILEKRADSFLSGFYLFPIDWEETELIECNYAD